MNEINIPIKNKELAISQIFAINGFLIIFLIFFVVIGSKSFTNIWVILIIYFFVSTIIGFRYYKNNNIQKVKITDNGILIEYSNDSILIPFTEITKIESAVERGFNWSMRFLKCYFINLKSKYKFGYRLYLNYEIKNDFKIFCIENLIKPVSSANAIDLGAGNGIQTIALAELGFKVKAIDFNNQLITELESKVNNYPVEVIKDDIRFISKYSKPQPELIVCCGDTLPHLDSAEEINNLIKESSKILEPKGKIVLTFRDYSAELEDTNRFIPVKSDSQRILTCFIEYFSDKIRVTDLLHELEDGKWIQKVSSYHKTRISKEAVIRYLEDSGLDMIMDKLENRIITIIGQKN